MVNLNAVKTRVVYGGRSMQVTAFIDSMSAGCFASPVLVRKLGAKIDRNGRRPIFQCMGAEVTPAGTVDLDLSRGGSRGGPRTIRYRFNVLEDWPFKMDLLVTAVMSVKTGLSETAYAEILDNIVAPAPKTGKRSFGKVIIMKKENDAGSDRGATDNLALITQSQNQANEEFLQKLSKKQTRERHEQSPSRHR